MTRKTSIETYNRITSGGLISKRRLLIYKIIYKTPELTGSQIVKQYKELYPATTFTYSEGIRNRITELVAQGVVKELGVKPCPVTGSTVLFYATTDSLPAKVAKAKTKKQKKKEILKLIEALAVTLPADLTEDLRGIWREVNKF